MQERILQALDLPYRVVDIAVGDLGASAGAEVRLRGVDAGTGALPGGDLRFELHPTTSRRLRARFRAGKSTEPVHTLNGTAMALGRTMIAILENHQREDGSVAIPMPLLQYGAPAEITPR